MASNQIQLQLAQATKAPVFDDSQQLRLKLERKLSDLVEKYRPRAGDFEESALERSRVGKRARLVAEELALEQGLWNRGAIDRHERLGGARTRRVETARKELLSSTRLANQQNRNAAAGSNLGS